MYVREDSFMMMMAVAMIMVALSFFLPTGLLVM
jgi:hypothetical protein